MEKQLYFDIDDAPSFVEDNFIISSSNQNATDYIYKWPNWASNCVVLFGESGVGKSHLANIWHNKAQALKVTLENVDFKDVQKSYKSSCSMPRRKISDIIINPDQRKKMILNKGDRIITLSN